MKELTSVILETIWAIICGVVGGVWDGAASFFEKPKELKYNAKFEAIEDFCSRKFCGFSADGNYNISLADSFKNLICFGSSGCGKTSSIIVNSIFSLSQSGASMCILNPALDILPIVGNYLKSIGYTVINIDWTSLLSARFNPYDYLHSVSEIGEFIKVFLENSIKEEGFWISSSELAMQVFMRLQIFHLPEDERNLGRLLELIEEFSANPSATHKYFAGIQDKQLLDAYRALCATPDRTLQSVLITLRVSLKAMLDNVLRSNTAESTFSLDDIRVTRHAIFLSSPANRVPYVAGLMGSFLQILVNKLMSKPVTEKERAFMFILDEATTVRFRLASAVSLLRKFRSGCLIAIQSTKSLNMIYNSAESEVIKANCYYQQYIGHLPLEDCQSLSKLLGKYSITDENGDDTGAVRELRSIDQLRENSGVLILAGGKAIQSDLTPYFKHKAYKKWARTPALSE